MVYMGLSLFIIRRALRIYGCMRIYAYNLTLQDIQEEPRRCIGPSHVKELAKFFMPTSDKEENSRVNNRTRRKKLFEPKKEEESEK